MIDPIKAFIAIGLVASVSFFCGVQFEKSGKDKTKEEVKTELIGNNTELSYRINHACGKDWEAYDWSVFNGTILISCSQTQNDENGSPSWYASKTVTIRR